MFETLKGFFELLRPPKIDAESLEEDELKFHYYDRNNREWRWVCFAWLLSVSAVICIQSALAFGFTPFFSGYALAADQRSTQHQVAEIKVEVIEGRLNETRRLQCTAIARDDEQAKNYYYRSLQELLSKYEDLAVELGKRDYRFPDCKEL